MPTYTYRCPQNAEHPTWDEYRTYKGSEVSEGPCPTCVEERGGPNAAHCEEALRGVKTVASGVSVKFKGTGFTPKFYPNREGK